MNTISDMGSAPDAHPPSPQRNRHTLYRQSAKLWQHAPLGRMGADKVARGLGWFSIGLGVAELLAPRAVAQMCGLTGRHTGLIRLCGLREIASGVLIFAQGRKPVAGMWSRVAGDAMDLATLAGAAALPSSNKHAVGVAAANVAGVAVLDLLCAQELSRQQGTMTEEGAIRVARSIVIHRRPDEIYAFWRRMENLPRFMYHLQEVRATGPNTSHWVTTAPGGATVEWDSELTADQPNELLAWRSMPGAQVENAGTVRFEPRPGGRGTIVRVELEYRPPGGIAGAAFSMLFNESPQQQLHDDLHRLKQVLEAGEVVRSDGSPSGMGAIAQHPARPAGQPAERPSGHVKHATETR
jgi:uncharacterized membrane protein